MILWIFEMSYWILAILYVVYQKEHRFRTEVDLQAYPDLNLHQLYISEVITFISNSQIPYLQITSSSQSCCVDQVINISPSHLSKNATVSSTLQTFRKCWVLCRLPLRHRVYQPYSQIFSPDTFYIYGSHHFLVPYSLHDSVTQVTCDLLFSVSALSLTVTYKW